MDYTIEIEKTEKLIDSTLALTQQFQDDPHRPVYHFMPPSAWMNDINGTIYWNGRYHLFYQYNPQAAYWNQIHWGHASSVDLVHWVHHPIALAPGPGPADRIGCFSGGAFISKEGIPTFIYYGFPDGICLATSHDGLLLNWTKHPDNPVIPAPQPGDPDYGKYTVHDPCAWLDGDTYYALLNRGNPEGRGDTGYLFKSDNLTDWEYLGEFYESSRDWTEGEEDLAVPDFFPLGDKYMLLFCSHLRATQYYLGRLENERFYPEFHARMSWPGGHLGGARTLLDNQNRRIFFDWIAEMGGVERARAAGWCGVTTVPRVLSLNENNTLRIEPTPELSVLRMNERSHQDLRVQPESDLTLEDVKGDCLELEVHMSSGDAQEFGVKVRCSPDGAEQTTIFYDRASRTLKVGVSRSTRDDSIQYAYYRNADATERLPEAERFVAAQAAPFELAAGESLELRIFLDHSVLEVFANHRECITQRIYPTRPDSTGVRLFSNGGSAHAKSIRAWDMAPTHN